MQNLRRLFTFLAFGPYNSKLVEAVTHVDDEKRVDNSLVQIWKVKLGHNVKLLFRLIEHKVSRFGQDFEVEVQARF